MAPDKDEKKLKKDALEDDSDDSGTGTGFDVRKSNHYLIDADEETGEGDSGKGGASGVEFVDFIGTGDRLRDDQLPADERKRLISVHESTHEIRVKKQKETRDQRQDLKNGKIPLDVFRHGMKGGGSQFKQHPALLGPQFSGVDRQVSQLPNENISETNNEKREELDYQNKLRYQPEFAPSFNPKPQPR